MTAETGAAIAVRRLRKRGASEVEETGGDVRTSSHVSNSFQYKAENMHNWDKSRGKILTAVAVQLKKFLTVSSSIALNDEVE